MKFQSVLCPDGIIADLFGPVSGNRHDAYLLKKSNLIPRVSPAFTGNDGAANFVIYGDPAYGLSNIIICPYKSAVLTPRQDAFNSSMSSVRTAVEWGFGLVVNNWAFVDFPKNNKILLSAVGTQYAVAVLLTNLQSCLYPNAASQKYRVAPPSVRACLHSDE